MTGRAVALVVFDLGGVLVRIVRGWSEAHERAGFAPHPILTDPEFAARGADLARAHQVGAIDPATWADGVARASRGAYTPADATRILAHWMYGEYPGASGVVDAVDRAGVEVAALSNTNAQHWDVLRPRSGPAECPTVARLPRAYASHELRTMKPDPAIYAHVEADVGVEPDRILFFEDTPANVEGARSRGWRAELVDPAADPPAQIMDALRRHGVI